MEVMIINKGSSFDIVKVNLHGFDDTVLEVFDGVHHSLRVSGVLADFNGLFDETLNYSSDVSFG